MAIDSANTVTGNNGYSVVKTGKGNKYYDASGNEISGAAFKKKLSDYFCKF